MSSAFQFCVFFLIFVRILCANKIFGINSSTIRTESRTDISTTTAIPTTISVEQTNTLSSIIAVKTDAPPKCADANVLFEDFFTIKQCNKILAAECSENNVRSSLLCDQFKCVKPFMMFIQHHYGPNPKPTTYESVKNAADEFHGLSGSKMCSTERMATINKTLPYAMNDMKYLTSIILKSCYGSTIEKCDDYIGGEFKEFGLIVIENLLKSNCSDADYALRNEATIAFCASLDNALHKQANRHSIFATIFTYKDDYKRMSANITSKDIIEELCTKLIFFLSREAFNLFFNLLKQHKESYIEGMFLMCSGKRAMYVSSRMCSHLFSNWPRNEVDIAVNDKCYLPHNYETTNACKEIISNNYPSDSTAAWTWDVFKIFREGPTKNNRNAALRYKMHIECNDSMANCEKFDQKLSEDVELMWSFTRTCCAYNLTMNLCNEYANKTYAHNQTEYERMLIRDCKDPSTVLASENSPNVCKHIYWHDCTSNNKRAYCEQLKFILTMDEQAWLVDRDEDELKKNARDVLVKHASDPTETSEMFKLVSSTKVGMVEMIRLACENSSTLTSTDSCDWVLKKVSTFSNNSLHLFYAMEYLCFNAERMNVFIRNNENICDSLWNNFCADINIAAAATNSRLHCASREIYFNTISDFNKSQENTTKLYGFLRAICNSEKLLDVLSCNLMKGMIEKQEPILRNVLLMNFDLHETSIYIHELCQNKVNRHPDFIEDHCLQNFVQIVNSEGLNGIRYCHMIHECSQQKSEEFTVWNEFAYKYYDLISKYAGVEVYETRYLHRYMNEERRETTLRRKYYDLIYLNYEPFRNSIIYTMCALSEVNCLYWLKKLDNHNLYPLAYKKLCNTKNWQKTKMCMLMLRNCHKVREDCKEIHGFFLDISFNPMVCQTATYACNITLREYCVTRIRDFRCKLLYSRMGAEKIIELLQECERDKQTLTCMRLFETMKESPSRNLIADVFKGYCTGFRFHGTACGRIKDFCFEVPKVGCYDVMQVYYPFWMDILVFCMEMSIFAFIFAVILFLKRRRNHRRILGIDGI